MIISDSLTAFFKPRGVAVIGATTDPTKLGYGLARNLVQSNYQGVVHFVNPKGGRLLGQPLHQAISQVPDPVDLAIALIPAKFVPEALHDCGKRGIRAVIIGSGGFRETGEQGAKLETECLNVAKSYGIRLIGPNCIGFLDTHLPINATFLPPPGPPPGEVAFVSHSGAICAAVIDWARGQGFGMSRLVSLGNQTDVNETDVLGPVLADPFTRVLTLYLEGVSDGRRFVQLASSLSEEKPIIALKVGRFSSGQRAVASHTGVLAGQESAFDAAFLRAGVIRANTSEEMFDWARALAWCPLPKGRNVAVLTNAGGPGVTAADALEMENMRLSKLKAETIEELNNILPPAASVVNPVDMLASATPEQYARCLQILLADSEVDSVMVILPPPPMFTAGTVAKALIPVIHHAEKPVILALMGERLIQEAVEHFRAARVAEYRFPERAASALAVLARRAEHLSRGEKSGKTPIQADTKFNSRRESILSSLKELQPGENLSLETVNDLLAAYGIPVTETILAGTVQQALAAARKIGYPVVLKIASPDILHKSEFGGVVLDVRDETSLVKCFEELVSRIDLLRPDARVLGVYVQPMVLTGQEVILGAVKDPQFGPLVMFGAGGVEVEGLQDVAFGLAPISEEEAGFILGKTWAGRRLEGFRNLKPADRQAAIQALCSLAQLAADLPQLEEIEINPLRILEQGKGVLAVDARARMTTF